MVNLKLTLIMRIFQRQIRMNDNIEIYNLISCLNLAPKRNICKEIWIFMKERKVEYNGLY